MTESAALEPIDDLPPHYFELYKIAVDMADRISARRVLANSFFATVNTGLIALIGNKGLPSYVALAGIVLSLVWWALLKSYRDLNAAKFKVILEMEKRLPVQIFGDEWNILKNNALSEKEPPKETPPKELRFAKQRKRLAEYRELGQVERIVPWMFAGMYLFDFVSRAWR